MRIRRLVVLALGGLLMGAATASAQACLGFPSRDGDLVVAGSWDGADEVGGDFHADVTGPGSFGFAYRTGLDDEDLSIYELRTSYDLYLLEPSMCLVAGLRFTDLGSDSEVSERLAVPVGFGVGKTLDTGRFATTVYAIPQYVWLREVRTTAVGGDDVGISNEFTGEAGVTVGVLPVFINGAFTVGTLDSDRAFRIRVGFIF